jgi:hypothetical protein
MAQTSPSLQQTLGEPIVTAIAKVILMETATLTAQTWRYLQPTSGGLIVRYASKGSSLSLQSLLRL